MIRLRGPFVKVFPSTYPKHKPFVRVRKDSALFTLKTEPFEYVREDPALFILKTEFAKRLAHTPLEDTDPHPIVVSFHPMSKITWSPDRDCGTCTDYVLWNPLTPGELFDLDPDLRFQSVESNGCALRYIRDQTRELCLAAVKENGHALKHVREQTEEICLAAVSNNGLALRHVREQTERICIAALLQNGFALQYVREQTEGICLVAVEQNGLALRFVREQTDAIRALAVHRDGEALQFIPVEHRVQRLCEIAVRHSPLVLEHVPLVGAPPKPLPNPRDPLCLQLAARVRT